MRLPRLARVGNIAASLILITCLGACRRAPESDTAASNESAAAAPDSGEPLTGVERAKKARAAALAEKEAVKRAVEFAQSAAAAAKNAAAAAERAAAAADAAVEAIRKIPPSTAPATPKPER